MQEVVQISKPLLVILITISTIGSIQIILLCRFILNQRKVGSGVDNLLIENEKTLKAINKAQKRAGKRKKEMK